MFKIGDFARINKVSVKTLHHYDELGILEPEKTDPFTNYRYYSASQMVRLNQILALKEAGFALAEIAEIYQERTPHANIIHKLEQKAEIMEQSVRTEQQRISRLRTNIFLIKNGGIPLMNEITIKKVEPILVASLRAEINDYDQMGELWENLNQHIDQMGCRKIIPCMTLYRNGWNLEQGMDIEVIEPIVRSIPESGTVKVYELPSVEQMACVVHKGPFETIDKTYHSIERWVNENNYELAGPVREIYHRGEWATDDPQEYVTEIQYPLK